MNGESNPVALVTGASKGIGRALVEHLLSQGYQVVGCSRSDVDWEAEGFLHLQADVSDEPQVKSLFRDIKRRYGRLDAAINNAAVASMNHFLLTPAASIEKMLSVNVVGTFLVSREAAKLMRASTGASSTSVHWRSPCGWPVNRRTPRQRRRWKTFLRSWLEN